MMWSTIARTTARQLRLASVRRGIPLTAELAQPQITITAATAARFAAILAQRQFSVTSRRTVAAAAKKAAPKKKVVAKKAAPKKKPVAKKAATKKKPAVKKKPAAKKKKPAPKKKVIAKKKPKKVLTDEEKKKLKIRELKKVALLGQTPKLAPARSKYLVYVAENRDKVPRGGNVTDNLKVFVKEVSAGYKALPAAELARLERKVEANRVANEAAHKAWISKIPVEEIAAAERARRALRRLGFSRASTKPINDPRVIKLPNAFALYLKTRWASGEFAGGSIPEAAAKIGADWKAMSAADRDVYHQRAQSPA